MIHRFTIESISDTRDVGASAEVDCIIEVHVPIGSSNYVAVVRERGKAERTIQIERKFLLQNKFSWSKLLHKILLLDEAS